MANTSKKTLITAAIVVALAAGGWYAWRNYQANQENSAFLGSNGRIEATEIDVATRLAGRVDKILVDEGAFVKAGQKRADALAKAVKYVLGAPPAAGKAGDDDKAKELADQRAAEARKKAAEANKKQPPDGKNVGLDSDKAGGGKGGDVDVLRLSQDKFAKLDEETKAKLRGDTI